MAVVGLLAEAPTASAAAPPLTLGLGDLPGVGLDAAGNAYVGWRGPQDELGIRPLMFCRIAKGASGCDGVPKVVAAPGTGVSYPAFVVTGARVVVAQSRAMPETVPGPFLITSLDGGSTFGAARNVGQSGALLDAVPGPGDSISVVGTYNDQPRFENIALGAVVDEPGLVTLSDSGFLPFAVLDLDGSSPAALVYADASMVLGRRYDGSGPLNSAANWSAFGAPPLGDEPGLAGGPLGLFATGRGGPSATSPVVHRFDGAQFGPAAVIEPTSANPRVEQDAGGRLHAVYGTGDLRYAISDDGANWRSGTLVPSAAASQPRLAAAADHSGAVVYSSGGQIHLAWLDTDVIASDPPAATPPPPETPPPPPPPPPAPTSAPAVPRGTPAASARKTINIAGARITLTGPRTCVPPRTSFRASLASTRTRRARFLAISRADFYVDGRRRATDRMAPFTRRLLLATAAPGTSHMLKARASIRLRGRRPVTRTLAVKLRICSA